MRGEKMAIVKQVSFKEKERELFLYANNRGNFSEYIKRLISADMDSGIVNDSIPNNRIIINQSQIKQAEVKTSDFIVEAERDDLEL